jgi:hypothetical protein
MRRGAGGGGGGWRTCVSYAACESSARIHPVWEPQPRWISIIIILCGPSFYSWVLQPLNLIQGQDARPCLLDPLTLITPARYVDQRHVDTRQQRPRL